MKRRLMVRSVAERDLLLACAWYEQRTAGLGRIFLANIDSAMARIAAHPLAGAKYFRDYRRMLVRRFPYGIFYIVAADLISVVAIMHLAQGPEQLKQSLSR